MAYRRKWLDFTMMVLVAGGMAASGGVEAADRSPAGELTVQGVIRLAYPDGTLQPTAPVPSEACSPASAWPALPLSVASLNRAVSSRGGPSAGLAADWPQPETPEWWSRLTKGSWSLGSGEVRGFVGARSVAWGPGGFGHLLVGGPTTLNWLLLSYDRSPWRYDKGTALLSSSPYRFLFAQRLEWSSRWSRNERFRPLDSVRLGWTETTTYQGLLPFPTGYWLPLVPYAAWSYRRPAGPTQWGVDAQLSGEWGRFYGELLLQAAAAGAADGSASYPSTPAGGPRLAGLLLGGERRWPSWSGRPSWRLAWEYGRTAAGTYRGMEGRDVWTGQYHNVGFWLGTDSEALVIRLERGLDEAAAVTGQAGSATGARGGGDLLLSLDKTDLAAAAVAGRGWVDWSVQPAGTDGLGDQLAGVGLESPLAMAATYGQVEFTRAGQDRWPEGGQPTLADGPTGTPESTVRISVGQRVQWERVKVELEVGVASVENLAHQAGQRTGTLVANVRVTIPLG